MSKNFICNGLSRLLRNIVTIKLPNTYTRTLQGVLVHLFPGNDSHEPSDTFYNALASDRLVRVGTLQSDQLRTSAIQAIGDFTLKVHDDATNPTELL